MKNQDVANWHKAQAKAHYSKGKKHDEMAALLMAKDPEIVEQAEELPPLGDLNAVTLAQLEAAVAAKGGRPNHLASRLNTTVEVIERLLELPASRYEIGERGFIYPKNAGN